MEDDVTPYYDKFREMDGLIVAAPVMTMGIPGALKSFMDRFQVFFNAKYVRKQPLISKEHKKRRKTLFISIGGMNIKNDFDCSITSMQAFCDIIDCPYWGDVLQNNMDEIKDVATKPDLMQAAYQKAYEMCSQIRKAMPSE
ncbi:MAG TPA: NAD(P)H-dependent oxidoreductase, partial [Methanomicrobiales archaeon]|nr:NAD(P)H-dependent oxidoreductase [Methanomicrobiales archaeon]